MNTKFCVLQLLILFSIYTLQACSTTMLMLGGTAAFVSSTWNDPRTIGTQLDDNILETHISHILHKNQQIKQFARIKNTVYQGNILLTGQTPIIELSNTAVLLIQNIHGTKEIYNAIRYNHPICLRSIIKDIWISTQIRIKLFIQNNIHLSHIKIITENKEVFLLGQVTYTEGKHIEKTIRSIPEVNKIFTLFTYI